MDGEKKESEGTGAANPLTRKLNKILNGDGVKGMQGPSEVRLRGTLTPGCC
eukprot:m.78487 g.78487  ORF g.78487 m.78487 type:complete len:51 (+) comp7966_c0_seq3:23-175(+)